MARDFAGRVSESLCSETGPRGFPADQQARVAAPNEVVFGNIRIKKPVAIAIGISIIFVLGFALGFGIDSKGDDPTPWVRRTSSVVGWIYFAAWSISFYPQLYINWVRKSVVGMSFDFQFLNLVGFACYSAFNVAYYYNNSIRADYINQYNGSTPGVKANDVFFALHALTLTLLTFIQIFMYDRGDQKFHLLPIVATAVALVVFLAWGIYLAVHGGSYPAGGVGVQHPWTWIDFLVGLSYVKLAISIVKYTPQVYLNYSRKRTTGWNIWNVLLDFTGGTLSIVQVIMDAVDQNDWNQVTGNPVKFGLGSCSMVFDVIFMIQHYCLYAEGNRLDELLDAERGDGAKPGERTKLVNDENGDGEF